MTKLKNQQNWDNLIEELDYIHDRINLIESHILTLKTASNTVMITVGALVKLLIDNEIISQEEIEKMTIKMHKDFKRQAKKQNEKLKKNDKQILYDALLKADFGGHA